MTVIIQTIQNHIGYITLNNPKKSNAITIELRDALIHAYGELQKNNDVKIIVLKANGKHFCSGADLNEMLTMGNASFEENAHDAKQLADLFYTIYHCTKPTVCIVQGKIMGGGLGLMAASDISVAEPNATFCFSEIKLGLIPAVISPFVVQRIGYQRAKYLIMTAEIIDAQQALTMQLIDRIDHDATSLITTLLPHSLHAL